MVDRQVGSDPACPSSEAAIGTKPVPRAVDAPKGLHGQVLGNTWVAHDSYDPGVDIALKLTYQRLERIDLAMREPLEQIHELLYRVLRDTNTQVTVFLGFQWVGFSEFRCTSCVPDLVLIWHASQLVAPFPPALSESQQDYLPPSRMQCEHRAHHPESSSEHENRGDRLLSSSPPLTECQQMSVLAGRARPCGRRSCAE